MASVACAQAVDATKWESGTVYLSGAQWRWHEGDDTAWAQASYDDRKWPTIELDDLGGVRTEWRWFRLRLVLPEGHPHVHLLLVGGDGTYELFVNGRAVEDTRLLTFVGLKRPTEMVVPLADDVHEFTLALRTHAVPTYTLWHLPLFLTITVGTPDAIENKRAAFESQRLYQALPSIAINLVLILAGFAAFALYRSQPDHAEYLWLGLYLFLVGLSNGLLNASADGILPLVANNLLGDPLIFVVTVMQIQFTFSFAGRGVTRVWRVYQAVLIAALFLCVPVTLGWLSITPYILIEAVVILPAALILPVLLFLWYQKGNREAGWLILPSLLPAATAALYDVGTAAIYTGWRSGEALTNPIALGPVAVQIADAGDFLFVLAIGAMMFLRFTRVSREQMRGAAELEAAREIQQRLVPAQLPKVRGYALEAAYFPAQEVGGDFYQVLLQEDGASLVVLGDVSGKGLKAAMTSTLALGALRTLAGEGLGPAAVLCRLNRQVAEASESGFITCVCVRLGEDGAVTLANAGHLAPYRNGVELALAPDLPLGIVAERAYAEISVQLEEGDRLMLLSDGVVEARDAAGALLGFERTRALSGETAAAIAAEARRFGQEDDITVVTVVRRTGTGD
jgi:hypothetical protein